MRGYEVKEMFFLKAIITFDFAKLFFYKNEAWEDEEQCADVVEVIWDDVDEFNMGDEVEILKIVESDKFSGGKGYVIYNPKNHASTAVACHTLKFIDEYEDKITTAQRLMKHLDENGAAYYKDIIAETKGE